MSKKKVFLLIIGLCISKLVRSQNELDSLRLFELSSYQSRSTSDLLLYNNPYKTPRFWVGTTFLGMWGWYGGPYFPMSLNLYYRAGRRTYLELYDLQDRLRATNRMVSLAVNYKLFNRLKERSDFIYAGRIGETEYSALVPIRYLRSLDVNFGMASDIQDNINYIPNDANLSAKNMKRTMMKFGLSWVKLENYWFDFKNRQYGFYRRGKFYFDLYYLLGQKYELYNANTYTRIPNDFPGLGVAKIGYKAGFEKILGLKNSGWGLKINLEFGPRPGLKAPVYGGSGNIFWIAGFGGLVWAQKPKVPKA